MWPASEAPPTSSVPQFYVTGAVKLSQLVTQCQLPEADSLFLLHHLSRSLQASSLTGEPSPPEWAWIHLTFDPRSPGASELHDHHRRVCHCRTWPHPLVS